MPTTNSTEFLDKLIRVMELRHHRPTPKERLARLAKQLKRYHLPGQHDQEKHGDWAEKYGPLLDAEHDIASKKTEYARLFVLNEISNVLELKGESHSNKSSKVVISGELVRAAKATNGRAVLTHNHPVASSLSKADLQAAYVMNLSEIRVVSKHGKEIFRFSVERLDSGWPPVKLFFDAMDKYRNQIEPVMIKKMDDKIIGQEVTDLAGTHAIMTLVSRDFGLKYKMIRVRRKLK